MKVIVVSLGCIVSFRIDSRAIGDIFPYWHFCENSVADNEVVFSITI